MRKLLPPALLVVAACNTLPPQVLPPPFGPATPQDTHLFFPTGLAVTGDGALLVANGNFNHAYDGGTIVGLPPDFVAGFFTPNLDCHVPVGPAAGPRAPPHPPPTPPVKIGHNPPPPAPRPPPPPPLPRAPATP